MELENLAKEILEKGYLMSLGVSDDGGVWVSDVIFVHDGKFNLYWLSETKTRHSQAILQNPNTAATITLSNNRGEQNIGLQITGNTRKVEGDILEIATKHRQKRNKPAPTKSGEILDPGESWYVLEPKSIDIIYEPLYGFEKKTLNL